MSESSAEKSHLEIQRTLKTPGGRILITAYTYSSMGNEVAQKQFPQISGWPKGSSLGNLLQVATILSTLLRIERHLGPRNYTAFHMSLVKEIASSVRHIYVPSLQGLACFLLQLDRSSLAAEEIPDLTRLLSGDETRLANSIGLWLVLTLKGIETLSEPADIEVAAALTHLAYHKNAKMIFTDVLADENLLKGIA
jgi:hypothetical protein